MHYTLRSYDVQLFKDIVIYVNEKNINALRAICERGVRLDPLSELSITPCIANTPAGYFAYQGNHEAVNLLLKDFRADIGFVIEGYAFAGDYERAFQLAKSDKDPLDLIARIAMAAAQRNEFELVKKKVGLEREVLDRTLAGYAMGGHVSDVNLFITEKAPMGDFRIKGHKIIQCGTIVRRDFIGSAAMGYSIKKHFQYFDELLIKAKELDSKEPIERLNRYEICLNMGAMGYALVGEFVRAMELVNKGASVNYVVVGAAMYGDVKFVEELICKFGQVTFDAALQGFLLRDAFETPATTTQLLAFIDNPEIRKMVADRFQKDNKDAHVSDWLEEAIKLNGLMRAKNLSYDEAVNHLNAPRRTAHAFFPPPPQGSAVIEVNEEYDLILKART